MRPNTYIQVASPGEAELGLDSWACVFAIVVLWCWQLCHCLNNEFWGDADKLQTSSFKKHDPFGCDREFCINWVYVLLQGMSTTLTWRRRLKILLDAAKGLAYLHDLPQPIIYRDFKTSNVLLDSVSCYALAWWLIHDNFLFFLSICLTVGKPSIRKLVT